MARLVLLGDSHRRVMQGYVSDRKDSKLSDIPAKGKAVIEYRLRSKSVNYAKDGTETHSSDIEVQSIDPQVNLEAVLERYDFARGDQLAAMIGGGNPPTTTASKSASRWRMASSTACECQSRMAWACDISLRT